MKIGNTLKVLAAAAFLVCGAAHAQNYPSTQVRLIVPQPPGGTTDTIGRLIGSNLSKMWDVPVVVENKGGAAQIIGTQTLSRAAPDGYTIGLVISTHAVNPAMHAKLPYDGIRDFAPISLIAWVTDIVTLNPELPPKTLEEFIAYVKANPGKLNYGSAGVGTSTHLAGELFQQMTDTKMVHVPYSGGANATSALLGGHVSMLFANFTSIMPHIKAGKLRALAVTSANRNPALPDLPTSAEAGLPGFEVSEWFGVLAPAGTPQPIVDKISADIAKVLADPAVREQLVTQGIEPVGSTPEEFATLIKDETAKWADVIKKAGIQPQ